MRLKTVVLLTVALTALVPAGATAQASCSIHTITGTYAVQITGQSLIGSLVASGAPYQLVGGEAVFVGRLTIAADGSVAGPLWGVYVAQAVEEIFTAQVSVNPDCTGELVGLEETFKFVVLDHGKEIQWVPWGGFGGSVATWYRITRADQTGNRCGQHTLNGNYAMRCEGFELTGDGDGVASSWSLFVLSMSNGSISGRVYAKQFGLPASTTVEAGVSGTYTVNEDCTVDKELFLDAAPGVAFKGRGVVFDQGKREVGLPLGVYAGETLVAPVLPLTCMMTRMGR